MANGLYIDAAGFRHLCIRIDGIIGNETKTASEKLTRIQDALWEICYCLEETGITSKDMGKRNLSVHDRELEELKPLAHKLWKYRNTHGLSQKRFAELAGIPECQVSRFERNISVPQYETRRKFNRVFELFPGVPPEEKEWEEPDYGSKIRNCPEPGQDLEGKLEDLKNQVGTIQKSQELQMELLVRIIGAFGKQFEDSNREKD